MNIIALTDIGLVRSKNQDSFFLSNEYDFPLFIIADGMGGHNGGEIASSDAIDIVKGIFLENKEKLINTKAIKIIIEEAIKKANTDIYIKSLELPEYNGMGTTISLCYVFENHIFIGHVGDSRIYKIKNDNIIQITEDHSLVNELIKKGEITRAEAKNHPQKNMITRAVGTSFDIEVDIIKIEYKKDYKFLICTDGLFNMVDEDQIIKIIRENMSIREAGKKLIEMAKKNGGLDNISLIIIEF